MNTSSPNTDDHNNIINNINTVDMNRNIDAFPSVTKYQEICFSVCHNYVIISFFSNHVFVFFKIRFLTSSNTCLPPPPNKTVSYHL